VPAVPVLAPAVPVLAQELAQELAPQLALEPLALVFQPSCSLLQMLQATLMIRLMLKTSSLIFTSFQDI
jgi:hypothetical protein